VSSASIVTQAKLRKAAGRATSHYNTRKPHWICYSCSS